MGGKLNTFHVGFVVRVIDRTAKFSAFRQIVRTGNVCNVGFVFRVRDPTFKFFGFGLNYEY